MGEWFAHKLEQKYRQALAAGLNDGLSIVEGEAVRLIMEGPKTGRIYKRGGVAHQASAPGEAPANDTGRLVNSRTREVIPSALQARLTFRTDYAAYLEFGTIVMEPRPFAAQSLINSREAVIAALVAPVRAIAA